MVMRNICTILARGGSTGLKSKNTKILCGKPLIHYTIEQALESELFDKVAVSSDSDEILDISSLIEGVEIVKRPKELADNVISKLPGIKHAVQEIENQYNCLFDNVIDLDPTSPLREVEDIHNAFNQFIDNDHDNLITAMPARRSPSFNMVRIDENNQVNLVIVPETPITCRQNAPVCYDMNASIYVWKRNVLFDNNSLFIKKTGLYLMPEERSIDIDNAVDFEFVEFIMGKKHVKK
jgi:CMP-N,N'-diacetyllegionaminic acid synthase